MNNMVMIGDSWFNLDQFLNAEWVPEERILSVNFGQTGFFRVTGTYAELLWEHMKKHAYNIVLEE